MVYWDEFSIVLYDQSKMRFYFYPYIFLFHHTLFALRTSWCIQIHSSSLWSSIFFNTILIFVADMRIRACKAAEFQQSSRNCMQPYKAIQLLEFTQSILDGLTWHLLAPCICAFFNALNGYLFFLVGHRRASIFKDLMYDVRLAREHKHNRFIIVLNSRLKRNPDEITDSKPALRSLNGFLTRCETKSSTTVGLPKSTVRLARSALLQSDNHKAFIQKKPAVSLATASSCSVLWFAKPVSK